MYNPQIHHPQLSRSKSPDQVVATRSDQKTQIIKVLEQELFELKNSHRDQVGLRNVIKETDLSIRQTSLVKKQRQVEFRLYLDQDADEIAQLTREKNDMQYALAEQEQQQEDLKAERQRLLNLLEEKKLTIKKTEHEGVQSDHQFDFVQREYRQLSQDQIQVKKEALERKEQIASLMMRLQGQDETQLKQRQRMDKMQAEIKRQYDMNQETEKKISALTYQQRQTVQKIEESETKTKMIAYECKEQVSEIDALTNDIEVLQKDNLEFCDQLEVKFRQLEDKSNQASSLEIQIKQREDEIRESKLMLDNLDHETKILDREYEELQDHKEALKKHTNILVQQNKTLTEQLEYFVKTDEQVRATLDRKERIKEMQIRNQEEQNESFYKYRDVKNELMRSRSKSPFKVSSMSRSTAPNTKHDPDYSPQRHNFNSTQPLKLNEADVSQTDYKSSIYRRQQPLSVERQTAYFTQDRESRARQAYARKYDYVKEY